MYTRTKLDAELEDARKKVAALEEEDARLKEVEAHLTPAKKLAVLLHDNLCRHNHTDGCSWYYDDLRNERTWTNEYGAAANYLEKAKELLTLVDYDKAIEIAKVFKRIY